jgi:hypothetical protein
MTESNSDKPPVTRHLAMAKKMLAEGVLRHKQIKAPTNFLAGAFAISIFTDDTR